jgi:outer membrane protein assembly factor BamB
MEKRFLQFVSAVLLLEFAALNRISAATNAPAWNVFRGPLCGVSPWTNAPADWDGPSGRSVLWRTPLKVSGVSSPVLWGSRLYITEGTDAGRAVLAFDAADGKPLWRSVVPDGGKGLPLPAVSDYGLAMPTPACDANGVYALFGTGDLAAFAPDGQLKWRRFLGRPTIGYGFSSSPCVLDNKLFVQFDHHADGHVLALDAETGATLWDAHRSRGASWSSLMVVPDPSGNPLVVANANGSTTAYDPTGRVAWDIDGATGEVAPSPAWWEGKIYAVNVGSRLLCHRVHGTPAKLWDSGGNLSDTASPVVVNGLLFMITASGYLSCIDAATGARLWTERAPGCYASLLSSGNRVYALGRDGKLQVIAAERTHRLIATCKLGEGADATPAMSDGRLYIRGSANLWCFGTRTGGNP